MKWEEWVKNKYLGKFFLRYALVGILVVLWVWKQERKKIHYFLYKEKKKILGQIFLALGLFFFFHFLIKFFWLAINSLTNLPHQSEKINKLVEIITNNWKSWQLVGLLVALCVLAPLLEECIFRYFVFSLFGRKNYFSYFFSFLTFVMTHYHWGENIPVLFIQYSAATFVFIYVYKKSGWNLLAPILLHSLVNLVFIVLVIINPSCFLI